MRDILVTMLVVGVFPFILARPHIGIYAWAWISYMNPHRLTYGFAYNFPFAAIIGIATLISLIFSKEPKSIPWTPITALLLIFILWMCLTTIFAVSPAAFDQWEKVVKIQFFNFIMLMVIRGRERIHGLVWMIAVSIGFFGVKGGIFTILTGGNYHVWGPEGTFFFDNNSLALTLLMVMPLLWYLRQQTEKNWLKHALAISMVLCALSIFASYSRGAFLAVLALGTVIFWKSKRRMAIILLLLLLIPIAISKIPDKWMDRMATIQTYEQDDSATGRINAWWFAFNVAKNNFLGGGFETFNREQFAIYAPDPDKFHDAHSIYFEVLGEHGFIGLAIFLSIGFLGWRASGKIMRIAEGGGDDNWAYDLAAAIRLSIVAYAAGGAFLGMAYFDLYYNLIAILVVTLVTLETQSDTGGAQNNVENKKELKGDSRRLQRLY